MSTKRASCGGIGTHSPGSNPTTSDVCRKQSTTSSNMQSGGGFTFEPKGERAGCESSVSISSLKNRLAPTIRNTLSAAVDTLLGEMVLVLTETQQELVTKEQENERLKVRLEVSERELKTLQECLCSAQKLIDQLQGPFGGTPNYGQQFYPTSPPGSMNPGLDRSRMGHRMPNGPDARCYGVEPEYGGAMGDGSMGYDSRDDYKNCHLSIQADGTVTNHMFDPMAVNSQGMPSDIHRPNVGVEARRHAEGPGLGPVSSAGHRLEVKEEQGQASGSGSGSSLCRRGGRERGSGAGEGEQTAQTVGDLGCIHVVEEEGGSGGTGGGAGTGGARRSYPPSHPAAPGTHGEASTSSGTRGQTGLRGAQKSAAARGSPATAGGAHRGGAAGVEEGGVGTAESMTGTDAAGGDRPHLCLECGKTFRLISSLKKHVRIHTGEKPYPCGVCGRRFRESGALKTHLRIHTGEKPYACSECGTRFRHLDGLRKHRRTHTGEKPYVCAICGKRLSRLQHLKHHQRIHTGERPCVCPCCHCTFKDPASLRKHLRTSHPEDPAAHAPDGPLAAAFKEDPEGGAGGAGAGGEDDPLQGSMSSSPGAAMRFGMWGEEEEQDDEEQPVVDCV
ncbi:hypothetical protein ACEWY4_008952 [Coilia grayii]|uniref:C2H2-type domain-containing protein n=1 Tax=Coilia grayii TaxID=363190 RepID=A0ABD1K5Q1_9TELE